MISGDDDRPGPALSAAMRLIRKPRAKKKRQALKLPAWRKDFTPAVLHVNKQFGPKARPGATIALPLRLGFNDGQVRKPLKAAQGVMGAGSSN
jgi:hypothetical protein